MASTSPSPPPVGGEAGPSRRIYRENLPLPEAVVIRDLPGPSRRPLSSAYATHTPDDLGPGYTSRGVAPPKWDSYAAWREWNVNTVKHGPPDRVNPPTFVPSSVEYDELGRSALHGVDVDVTAGKVKAEELEDGEKVAGWYRSLSTSTSALPSRTSSPKPTKEPPDPSASMSAPVTRHQPILNDSLSPMPPVPLKVHSKEWFIRRALLTSHQRNSGDTSTPKPIPTQSSISTLLNIPSQPKATQAQYVLGPENRGYALLKDRLGWEGGGLGRAPDWVPLDPTPAPTIPPRVAGAKGVVVDDEGVIDVTGFSSDEGEAEGEDEVGDEDVEVPGPGGPGRTAPIATSLKLDRLGLGHRRAAPREHLPSTVKKVTHTAAEIREAQRRSRIPVKRGVELGKKGKVKWKVRDQRERDERRRLAAALNA